MDFNQSKAILKKINALHDSAVSFEGEMSSMERDLLLHYLREMYEVVLSKDKTTVPKPAQPVVTKQEATPEPPVPAAPPTPQRQSYTPPPVVQYEAPKPPAPVYREPATYTPPPVPSHTNGSYQAPPPVVTAPVAQIDDAIRSLFEEEDQQVSSRFSQLPISDIGKSMGLNDKILTRNELFNGSSSQMDDVIRKLNSFSKYEEAKTSHYL